MKRTLPLALLLSAPCAAQATLLEIDCLSCGEGEVMDACHAGDVDGDGFGDVAVITRDLALQGALLRVVSGRDGAPLRSRALGGNVANATLAGGDVDGDGAADVIVGLPLFAAAPGLAGRVLALSGRTGDVLWTVDGEPFSYLGTRVVSGLDVDGDGHDDVLASANWCFDPIVCEPSRVLVLSGASGAELYRLQGAAPDARFGEGLSALGDHDLDGSDDIIAPVWSPTTGAAVAIVRGIDGTLLRSLQPTAPGGEFGYTTAGPGDVTGDGVPDVAASTVGSGAAPPRVELFSGADGSLVWTFEAPEPGVQFFGYDLAAVGDVTGDGLRDLLVSSRYAGPPQQAGAVRLLSGADGTLQHIQRGDAVLEQLGVAVDGVPDLDGDGLAELLFASLNDPLDPLLPGPVRVLSGAAVRAPVRACIAAPNSVGAGARLGWGGTRSLADNDLDITVEGGPPGHFSLLVHGVLPTTLPFGDGFLCISPFAPGLTRVLPVVALDGAGTATWDLDLGGPFGPAAGESWTFQVIYRDTGPAGFNGSDALRATFVR